MQVAVFAMLLPFATPNVPFPDPGKTTQAEREPRYDPATVVELLGDIENVREEADSGALQGFYVALFKTETESLDIYLGPIEFIRRFDVGFKSGDRLQVIGSKVRTASGWFVLAREVERDNSTLYLRNKQGRPYWEPWKARTPTLAGSPLHQPDKLALMPVTDTTAFSDMLRSYYRTGSVRARLCEFLGGPDLASASRCLCRRHGWPF